MPKVENSKVNDIYFVGPSPFAYSGGGLSSYQADVLKSLRRYGRCVNHVSTYADGGWFYRFKIFLLSIYKIWQVARKGDVIFHIHTSIKGSLFRKFVLMNVMRISGKSKIVVHSHGADVDSRYYSGNVITRLLTERVFGGADAVICLSNSWKDFLENINVDQNRIFVLPNPIDIPEAGRLPGRNDGRILFIGGLSERKGVSLLLNSIDFLKKNNIKAYLDLIGGASPSMMDKYQKMTLALGIEDRVKFHGWISREKIIDNLAQAKLFVLPSKSEGLPIAMLEAMSMAVPVLVTTVGGIPEVIKDKINGFLISPDSQEDLNSSLLLLLDNSRSSYLDEVGVAGREYCKKNLSIMVHCDSLCGIYDALS